MANRNFSNAQQSAPANATAYPQRPLNARDFQMPTALPQQYAARTHRAAAKEQRADDAIAAQRRRYEAEAARFAPQSQCGGPTCAGRYVPLGNERLHQVYAKQELYADVPAPERVQPAMPLVHAPNQREMATVDPRLPTIDKREQREQDDAERRARAGQVGGANALVRNAAQRAGNFSVSAADAEKKKYQQEYTKDNEEAYAHVKALQQSVRGYEDTSKDTMDQVQRWNQREAGRRQFFSAW